MNTPIRVSIRYFQENWEALRYTGSLRIFITHENTGVEKETIHGIQEQDSGIWLS